MILPADVVDSAVHFTYSLQTGSYPETGLEEINGDLREADAWSASLKVYSGA